MAYNKIVIISSHEFDRRISILFQTKTLKEKGANIEYWNTSDITFREHVNPIDDNIIQTSISSLSMLEKKVVENLSSTVLYIVYMNYCYITYPCYRILSKYNCDILYCINGVLPVVLSSYRKYTAQTVIKGIKNRIANFMLLSSRIKPAKFELKTCAKAGDAYKIDNNTIKLSYNSTDFEDSLHFSELHIEKPYIVFLDQYLPLHPDNKLAGEMGANVHLYYEQMNHLFSILEKNHHCEVIIAAHPAAKSYIESNPFNGRRLFTGRTKDLVKGSLGVVAHFSTAVFFAVIYEKPMLLATSLDISSNLKRVHRYCEAFAKELNCHCLMLDNIPNELLMEPVDYDAYKRFKYNYITNPTSESISNVETLMSIYNGEL